MLLRSLRYGMLLIAVIALMVLWQLPSSVKAPTIEGLEALPDADLAAIAEDHWQHGYRESAISILQYNLDTGTADLQANNKETGMAQSLPLTRQLLKEYKQSIANEKSLDGRLWKMGSGAVTGEIDSWESMAGSTVADLFVIGDIRDLVVQGFIADETDELIMTLSAVGIATTAWPPADPAVSMLKAARKSQSISEPIVNQLMKTGKAFKDAPNAKNQTAFIETVKPLWEMGNKCHSWSQFKLLLKHSDNISDVKTINRMISAGPQQAKQLNSAFAICHKSSSGIKSLFKLCNSAGQRSCNAIYAVLRKGPPGINWLGKHPKLIARLGKIGYKDGTWAYNAALRAYGKQVLWLKNLGILLCLLVIILCSPLKRLIPFKNKECDTKQKPRLAIWATATVLSCTGIAGLMALAQGPTQVAWTTEELGIASSTDISEEYTRELRVSMREYDSVDPNDYFQQTTTVPLIQADDGSHWLFCTRQALGLDWPEINDGDIDQLSFIISKRGPNPKSARLLDTIRLFSPDPRFCLIKCPQGLEIPFVESHEKIEGKFHFIQAAQMLRGASITTFSEGNDGMAVKMQLAPEHQPKLGDFVLDNKGQFVGYFVAPSIVRYLAPKFQHKASYQVRHQDYDQNGYYSQFVSDVQSLP